MLKPQKIVEDLGREAQQVEAELKKLQEDCYETMKIPEAEYELQSKVLSERLAEIEGERATLNFLKSEKKLKGKNKKNFMEKNQISEDIGEEIISKLRELSNAIKNLKSLLDKDFKGKYKLEIVDILNREFKLKKKVNFFTVSHIFLFENSSKKMEDYKDGGIKEELERDKII